MSIKQCFVLIFTLVTTDIMAGQTCKNTIPKTTPDNAFTLHNNGTVTHNKTGLMWMRCELGQTWDGTTCNGSSQAYQWTAALQVAETYTFAGYSNWRLPNKNELDSIVEEACNAPAINTLVFPVILLSFSSYTWSSSPYADHSYDAWAVDFYDGFIEYRQKTNGNFVRLVRGGQ
ncbi:MAG: DUF1566 domain-containing protein [Methylococcaceae bacterium]